MIKIIQDLTTVNFRAASGKKNKYIVLHYTANDGDTAAGNANYFRSVYRGASAQYFVDEIEAVQVVDDKNISWHCGDKLKNTGGGKWYGKCTNSNSIGIEMCSRKKSGIYYISDKTLDNTVELVKMLMEKYNIPVENVIRHYDVTGKLCPYPYVDNDKWQELKARFTDMSEKVYNSLNEFSPEFQTVIKWCMDKGIVKGTGNGLGLTMTEAKCLVFIYRAMKK